MSIETLLTMIVGAIVCMIFYLSADRVYNFHFKLKTDNNPLSKLITGDRKTLDDKEQWIRRYRAKVMILLALVITVPLIITFAT